MARPDQHGSSETSAMLVVALPLFMVVLPLTLIAHRRSRVGARLAWLGDSHADDSVHDLGAVHNPFPLSVDPMPYRQHQHLSTLPAPLRDKLTSFTPSRGTRDVAYQRTAATEIPPM